MGVGNIQPMVRYQWADIKGNTGTNPWNLDAAVAYLIKGPALRLVATYSYTKLGSGHRRQRDSARRAGNFLLGLLLLKLDRNPSSSLSKSNT